MCLVKSTTKRLVRLNDEAMSKQFMYSKQNYNAFAGVLHLQTFLSKWLLVKNANSGEKQRLFCLSDDRRKPNAMWDSSCVGVTKGRSELTKEVAPLQGVSRMN